MNQIAHQQEAALPEQALDPQAELSAWIADVHARTNDLYEAAPDHVSTTPLGQLLDRLAPMGPSSDYLSHVIHFYLTHQLLDHNRYPQMSARAAEHPDLNLTERDVWRHLGPLTASLVKHSRDDPDAAPLAADLRDYASSPPRSPSQWIGNHLIPRQRTLRSVMRHILVGQP